MEQAVRVVGVTHPYSWRTHSGAELDLMWQAHGALWGMEFKYQDAPRMTKSIRAVLRDRPLQHLSIVYPGPDRYRLDNLVSVLPVAEISSIVTGPVTCSGEFPQPRENRSRDRAVVHRFEASVAWYAILDVIRHNPETDSRVWSHRIRVAIRPGDRYPRQRNDAP